MPSPRAADDARRTAPAAQRSRATFATLAGGLAVAMLLTGCTGDPVADPTPTPSVSSTPTPAPSPTPTTTPEPERPAAMDDPGIDGAVATATYFLSLYPYVYNTGDLTAWKALSHPECIFCASVKDGVEETAALQHRYEGTALSVVSATGTEVDPGVFFAVEVRATQVPGTEVDADGTVIAAPAPGEQDLDISMVVLHEAGSWIVRAVETVPAGA